MQEERLREAGQDELADVLAGAGKPERERLAAQVAAVDLDLLRRAVRDLVLDPVQAAHEEPGPPEVVAIPRDAEERAREAEARAAGEELLRAGRVAVVLLAGGQGTRLGFEGPKGDYPFAPITGRTLFAHHAAKVAAVRRRYGCDLPWLVMTSPQNDVETRESFARHGHFGLPPESVRFFVQGTLPAVDRGSGAILREAPDRLALSPDGHGGLLPALRRAGLLDELSEGPVTTLFTFQVDNPMVRLARPELLGYHALAGAEMASVVVRKRAPEERMGVVASVGGRTALVEYSDLPPEQAALRDERGELVFWAGSIAVHCLELGFVERMVAGPSLLPLHRADKRVPYLGPDGRLHEPDSANAVKFESFLFDALPEAAGTVTVEAAREDEFSPIKNAEGDDSPATARRDLNRLYARWLEAAGTGVPRDGAGEPRYDLEIDPRLALDAEELRGRLPAGLRIEGPTALGPQDAAR
jgi:UDP-N-acetylglucosamine/UDP-N-acetylgalactosamine diphosphorylase